MKKILSTEGFSPLHINKKALSIIEVMVAIFIFTLWMSGVYMVISSTVWVNKYNHDFIIASNLAREDIELIRNIRDTNYENFQKWNTLEPNWGLSWVMDYDKVFTWSLSAWLYRLELKSDYKIKTSTWTYFSEEDIKKEILKNSEEAKKYKICLDSYKRYIYCKKEDWNDNSNAKIKTHFYKFLEIRPLETKLTWWTIIENAFKVRSKVFWRHKSKVKSTEISTILTDWKRL